MTAPIEPAPSSYTNDKGERGEHQHSFERLRNAAKHWDVSLSEETSMILGPMILGVLSGLAAASAWMLTGGSIWIAFSLVYAFASALGLVASATLLAIRLPEETRVSTGPRRTFRGTAREADRRKRRVTGYGPVHRTAVGVRHRVQDGSTSHRQRS